MRALHRLTLILLTSLSLSAVGEPLRLVSEPWAPYIYEENGTLRGLDYDTTVQVLERLGIQAEWQLLPWKRCLSSFQQGQADGILDIFRTAEREPQMVFHEEPLSEVELLLFQAKARPHPVERLDDLDGLMIGVSPGYWYSNQAFRESTRFVQEPAPTHEANFGKLMRGRIDLLVTDRRAGRFLAAQLGLAEKIEHNPLVISRDAMYLGLRRTAELEDLAARFSAELRRFKGEPAYAALLARYAQERSPSVPEREPR